MASLGLYPQFETNLISNCRVIELLLQAKSAKTCGQNYIKVIISPGPPSLALSSIQVPAIQFTFMETDVQMLEMKSTA